MAGLGARNRAADVTRIVLIEHTTLSGEVRASRFQSSGMPATACSTRPRIASSPARTRSPTTWSRAWNHGAKIRMSPTDRRSAHRSRARPRGVAVSRRRPNVVAVGRLAHVKGYDRCSTHSRWSRAGSEVSSGSWATAGARVARGQGPRARARAARALRRLPGGSVSLDASPPCSCRARGARAARRGARSGRVRRTVVAFDCRAARARSCPRSRARSSGPTATGTVRPRDRARDRTDAPQTRPPARGVPSRARDRR